MKFVFSLLVFLIVLSARAQHPDDYIQRDSLNVAFLEHLTKVGIDSVRRSHNLEPLYNDSILYLAARDHARYLTKRNTVSHNQPDRRKKETPQLRVAYYGGHNYQVGENVALVFIQEPLRDPKGRELPYQLNTYRETAADLVKGWVNSPGHFANIKTKEYTITGLAVEFDHSTNALRAVQKFALVRGPYTPTPATFFPFENMDVSGVAIPSAVPTPHRVHAYRLKDPGPRTELERVNRILQRAGDMLIVEANDSLFLYIEKTGMGEQLFVNRRDGLSLEAVPFEMYACDGNAYTNRPSRRNGGCISNGRLIKPVYRKKLKADERNYFFLARKEDLTFPATWKEVDLNVLVIQDKRYAGNIQLSTVCGEFMEVNDNLPFKLPEGSPSFIPRLKLDTFSVQLNFERNQTDFSYEQLQPLLLSAGKGDREIKKISIQAFASVEGTQEANIRLFTQRAENIVKSLQSAQDTLIEPSVRAIENWPMFYRQIAQSEYAHLGTLDTPAVRDFVNAHSTEPRLAQMLDRQRYATIVLISYPKVTQENISLFAIREFDEFVTASREKELSPVQRARMEELMAFLYHRAMRQDERAARWIDTVEVKSISADLAYYKTAYQFGRDNDVQRFVNALQPLSAQQHSNRGIDFNLAVSAINSSENGSWFMENEPKVFQNLIASIETTYPGDSLLERMKLFYHVYNSKLVWETHYNVRKSRTATSYLKTMALESTDEDLKYKVALHLAACQQYRSAYEVLKHVALQEDPDEKSLVLLAKIISGGEFGMEKNAEIFLSEIYEKLPQADWCALFRGECNITFQYFDHPQLRNLYCERCED